MTDIPKTEFNVEGRPLTGDMRRAVDYLFDMAGQSLHSKSGQTVEIKVDEIGMLLSVVFTESECKHQWVDGFSMNGPTKSCTVCGLFMRD